MPRIVNWSVKKSRDEFIAPELRALFLHGNIFGHPSFKNGEDGTTSHLQFIDLKNKIAKTRSTYYDLGEPSKEYLEWCRVNCEEKYVEMLEIWDL